MPFVNRKQKARNIRRADIIVIGKKKFIVRDNEPASLIIKNMRCLVLRPVKSSKQDNTASLYVADHEKFKIIRHK